MTAATYFLSLLLAVLIAAFGELVSDEIRARLDRVPLALLSAAARRLSPEQRVELYERAWLPELHHILRGDQATPITRLIHGMRYAMRLWLSAPQIRRELEADNAPVTLFKRVLQFVFDPSCVAATNISWMPFVGAAAGYAARHPSWASGVVAALVATSVFVLAIFCRRLLIRGKGYVPSREMFCQCIVSTMFRALVILSSLASASIVTILTYRLTSISSCSLPEACALIGCVAAPTTLMQRGFVLPVTPTPGEGPTVDA